MRKHNVTLVTGPTEEPITLEEAKLHSRIDNSDEDSLIEALIVAARELVETQIRRQLCTATWRLSLDCFPDVIRLPKPPLLAVTSIVYLDTAGASNTLDPSRYVVDADSEPARIVPAYGTVWPTTIDRPNAVKVTYTAGFGGAADLPATAKQAVKLLFGHFYENRESAADKQMPDLPVVDRLLASLSPGIYA